MTKRETILAWAIERSFKAKTGILFFGAILIVVGTEIRIDHPLVGYSLTFVGLVTDWGIVYLVYREIRQIRDEVERTKDEIEDARSELDDTRDIAEEAEEKAQTWA